MKENKLELIIGAVVLAVALVFIVFVYQNVSIFERCVPPISPYNTKHNIGTHSIRSALKS